MGQGSTRYSNKIPVALGAVYSHNGSYRNLKTPQLMKRSDFLNELADRGLIYQATDLEGLKAELDSNPNPAAYVGFDCTAVSLHVGNLMQIMMLRLLQKY